MVAAFAAKFADNPTAKVFAAYANVQGAFSRESIRGYFDAALRTSLIERCQGQFARLEKMLNIGDCIPIVGSFIAAPIRGIFGTTQILLGLTELVFRATIAFFYPQTRADQFGMFRESVELVLHGSANLVHAALIRASVFSWVLFLPYELCKWPRYAYSNEPVQNPIKAEKAWENLLEILGELYKKLEI